MIRGKIQDEHGPPNLPSELWLISSWEPHLTSPAAWFLCPATAPWRTVSSGVYFPALPDGDAAANRGRWVESGRLVPPFGPLAAVWSADRRPARAHGAGFDDPAAGGRPAPRNARSASARCGAGHSSIRRCRKP